MKTQRPSAGYSGRPLPGKLGVKPGMVVALLGAPPGFRATLGPLPEGAVLSAGTRRAPGLVIWFVRSRADLEKVGPVAAFAGAAHTWIAWRTGGRRLSLASPGDMMG